MVQIVVLLQIVSKYIIVGLISGMVIINRGCRYDWIGESRSQIILLNMVVHYAIASPQTLTLNLVGLRQLLLLTSIEPVVLLNLISGITLNLIVISTLVRTVHHTTLVRY